MDCIIVHNDIVTMSVDAIVLPSNTELTEGPGASAAIFAKAGKSKLQRACKEVHSKFQKKHWGLTAGKAVVTQGFGLDAKYIIHAIVPKWVDGKHNEYASLSATYISALTLGDALGCELLAFPLLASGHNGYNLDTAFQIAEESIKKYTPKTRLQKIYLVLYGFRAVQVARERGFEVEEFIDQRCVFEKEEELKAPLVKLLEKSEDFVAGTINNSLDELYANLESEENQKVVMAWGSAIATQVLKSRAEAVQISLIKGINKAFDKQ